MAELTLAQFQKAKDNNATVENLTSKMNSLESQVIAWMGEVSTLQANVVVADRQQVTALKTQLITKLTAAIKTI